MAEVIEDAFRYDKIVVAAATYDGGIFPVMEDFLRHLKSKNYQKTCRWYHGKWFLGADGRKTDARDSG